MFKCHKLSTSAQIQYMPIINLKRPESKVISQMCVKYLFLSLTHNTTLRKTLYSQPPVSGHPRDQACNNSGVDTLKLHKILRVLHAMLHRMPSLEFLRKLLALAL